MKICVILSSYEGSGSAFEEFDSDYQDPQRYTKSHQFHLKFIKKASALEELDEICSGDYDFYWSFLWGTTEHENIAGLEALKYLESKNVPLLGTSSKFLAMTKLDVKRLMVSAGVQTPTGTTNRQMDLEGMRYPMIVKASNSCGSLHMTQASVCSNLEEVQEQIRLLESKIKEDVVIEEFIVGSEVSVMVLETPAGVIALTPIVYKFPNTWTQTQKFLDFHKKFVEVEEGRIDFDLLSEGSGPVEEVKRIAIKAYEALGVFGSGYSRVDFRITPDNDIFLLEVNNTPAFFCGIGNRFGDDFVIEKTFPGGHEAFIDTIIASKQRIDYLIFVYNDMSASYDETNEGQNCFKVLETLVSEYEFGGRVLDLGCGTGIVGRTILKKFPESFITGIDFSPAMVEFAKEYSTLHVGLLENVMMELSERFDHSISFGTFLNIDPSNFVKILDRMFQLTQTSISFVLEDVQETYNELLTKIGRGKSTSFCHLPIMETYIIPKGWTQVLQRREYMWTSPRTGYDMYGVLFRFEQQ